MMMMMTHDDVEYDDYNDKCDGVVYNDDNDDKYCVVKITLRIINVIMWRAMMMIIIVMTVMLMMVLMIMIMIMIKIVKMVIVLKMNNGNNTGRNDAKDNNKMQYNLYPGLHDRTNEGHFTWMDGLEFADKVCAPVSASGGNLENCVAWTTEKPLSCWSDKKCADRNPFMCRMPVDGKN